MSPFPAGSIGYVQLPTTDLDASIAFYAAVFGWQGEATYGSFDAPGVSGQWTTELAPAGDGGPVLWLNAEGLYVVLTQVVEHGGRVRGRPQLDQGKRWLVEVDDPSGNRLGIVVPARTGRPHIKKFVEEFNSLGKQFASLRGYDPTGMTVARAAFGRSVPYVLNNYGVVIDLRIPLYGWNETESADGKRGGSGTLLLPLSEDGQRVDWVLVYVEDSAAYDWAWAR